MPTVEHTPGWIRRLTTLGFASSCWLLSTSALPQSETESAATEDGCAEPRGAQDPEAARVAFRAGQTAFSEGAYGRAVELWNQAYRDDCTAHALLLNLAMAQELLDRPDDAIHTLTLFNRRSPTSPYVEANTKRIRRLERSAAERRREHARRERLDWAPAKRPPAEAGPGVSLPVAVTIAGGAVAVVGGVLFLEGRLAAASADDRCGSRDACAGVDGVVDGERARTRAEVGGWIATAGLATAAGGLLWHFLSRPERPMDQSAPPPAGLSLVDVPGAGAGVGWSSAF